MTWWHWLLVIQAWINGYLLCSIIRNIREYREIKQANQEADRRIRELRLSIAEKQAHLSEYSTGN